MESRPHQRSESEELTWLTTIAREHWINGKSQRQIALALGLDPSTITRALQQAREKNIIDFRVDGTFGSLGRPNDAGALRNAFKLDHYAIAVNMGDGEAIDDDYLHIVLGNNAAKNLVIESGDHIAVTGGRAVMQAARFVARRPPPCQNLRISPLEGRFWVHQWQIGRRGISRPLDADDAATTLAQGFSNEPGTAYAQIVYPFFAPSDEEAQKIRSSYCSFLSNGEWRGGTPNRAMVGVGALDRESGHRLLELYRGEYPPGNHGTYLAQATAQLKRHIDFAGDNNLGPLGDVGCGLFVCVPLPSEFDEAINHTKQRAKLIGDLLRFNRRMVAADWRHVQPIPHVLAIAGGARKLGVLWTVLLAGLLHPSQQIITALCTDATTADWLLAAYHRFENLPEEAKAWYAEATAETFAVAKR